eukprot:3688839-Rhodomonas_salina.2
MVSKCVAGAFGLDRRVRRDAKAPVCSRHHSIYLVHIRQNGYPLLESKEDIGLWPEQAIDAIQTRTLQVPFGVKRAWYAFGTVCCWVRFWVVLLLGTLLGRSAAGLSLIHI